MTNITKLSKLAMREFVLKEIERIYPMFPPFLLTEAKLDEVYAKAESKVDSNLILLMVQQSCLSCALDCIERNDDVTYLSFIPSKARPHED